ncbi:uroporphyrinogen-III synthase [Hydrogenophaga palleronii]|uniref:uroporphyrinogen-III synthase n=1 Tax=Hydrogenophaga palleronii TaxID=65655 RepID=UPI0008247198|nr:uroporphyrinogen-III synthase [Hydrogenophaga palleronii]
MAGPQTPPTGSSRLERLIVTRPAPEAANWAAALCEQGWPALALPLIEIAAPATEHEQQALSHWRAHWAEADAIMFVSAAAVKHFFSDAPERALAPASASAPSRTRFWAPGPGTARVLAEALARLGLPPDRIDAPATDAAQFDSEHLWPVVAGQVGPGRRVLVVRGTSAGAADAPDDGQAVAGSGREWLIRQCQAAGAQVQGCVAYARRPPVLSAQDLQHVEGAREPGSVWLFSSSEAFTPLQALYPASAWARASALVTHPRIAAAAQHSGFGHVVETRPALADVVRALESTWTPP